MAQPTPIVAVSQSPVQTVHLTPLLRSGSPVLSKLITDNPTLASTIVMVANQSPQPIVAVSAVWKFRDATGRERRSRQQCDAFLPASAGRVIAPPKSILYLGPNTCFADESTGVDRSAMVAAGERETLGLASAATQIDIAVDAILFQDGAMFAPDSSYLQEITARVAAANALAAHVRSEVARGRTVQQALQSLLTTAQSEVGSRAAWLRDFSHTLSGLDMRKQGAESYLSGLERLTLPSITLTKVIQN